MVLDSTLESESHMAMAAAKFVLDLFRLPVTQNRTPTLGRYPHPQSRTNNIFFHRNAHLFRLNTEL